MRITRAAKVAAFPLIVLALVALIACQGPIGPKGDTGDTGDTGDAGMTGTPGDMGDQGDPGFSALTLDASKDLTVLINDGEDAAGGPTIGGPKPVDLTEYFSGGSDMITYSATRAEANKDHLDVSYEGTMATITLKSAATGYNPAAPSDNGNGGDGYPVTVKAEDMVLETEMTVTLTVVRNAAPEHGNDEMPNLIIGTDPKKSLMGSDWPSDDGGAMNTFISCETMDTCTLTMQKGDDPAMKDVHQFVDYGGKLTYRVESEDRDKVMVQGGAKITVTGVTSTETAAGVNTFEAQGVTITVWAMDMGTPPMESEKRTFKVIVDAQPVLSDDAMIPPITLGRDDPDTSDVDESRRELDLTFFVEDATSGDARWFLPDNEGTYPRVMADINAGVLMLEPTTNGINGPREVKVRYAEPVGGNHERDSSSPTGSGSVGQYLDFSIMVTNDSN